MNYLYENTHKALEFYEKGLLSESELLNLIESGVIDIELLDEGFVDSLKNGVKKAAHIAKRTLQVGAVAGTIAGGTHIYDQHQKGAELYKNIEKADSALSNHIANFNSKNKTMFGNASELNNHLSKEIDRHNSNINLYKNDEDYKKSTININNNKELIDKYNTAQKVIQNHDKDTNENLKKIREPYESLRKEDSLVGRKTRNIINSSETAKKIANWAGINTDNPKDKILNDADKKEEEYLESRKKSKQSLEKIANDKKKEMDDKGITQSIELKKSFDNEIDKEEKEKDKLSKIKTETDKLDNNSKTARDKYYNSKAGIIHNIVSGLKHNIFGK